MLEPTVTYVVITPGGLLLVRTVDNRIEPDEWGTPYQESLWAAVRAEVDPHRGEVNGIGLAEGMRAKVADAAMGNPMSAGFGLGPPALYPPNPVASAMLTTLGHPARPWWGTIVIVGREDQDEGVTASLTAEQHAAIAHAYRSAIEQSS